MKGTKKMQQHNSTVTVRTRVNHTHTLKDGWRLNETTVEVTGSLTLGENDTPMIHAIQFQHDQFGIVHGGRTLAGVVSRVMEEITVAGQAEADRRNADDRIELGDALVARGGK